MKTKIIIFDFDGTLSISDNLSTWQKVWKYIPNGLEQDSKLLNLWKAKKITDKEWNVLTVKAFHENNLTAKTLDEIANKNSLINNIEDVFKFLKNNNIEIHILSGGIKNIIEKMLGNLIKYVTNINAYTIIFNADNVIVDVTTPTLDPNYKHLYVQNLLKTYHLLPEEVFYVGNDWNDEVIASTNVPMLCINPNKTNAHDKNIWDYAIEQTNSLTDIIKFIK